MNTWLFVGLGNPGKEYEHTPHNVGFAAVDALWDYLDHEHYSPTPWKFEKSSNALVSTCVVNDHKLIMAKPQTFMNLSGSAVMKLMASGKWLVANLIILHDDIDITQGTVRIRKNGSSAGHKGIQSIIDTLGTEEFCRVRIGIRPFSAKGGPASGWQGDTTTFVLQKMPKATQQLFHTIFSRITEELLRSVTQGIQETTLTIP